MTSGRVKKGYGKWRPQGSTICWLSGLAFVLVVSILLGLKRRESAAERMAIINLARGQTPEAASALLDYASRYPDDEEIRELLIARHARLGIAFADLEPHVDQLCTAHPNSVELLKIRARLRAQNGLPEGAVIDGLRVLELTPQDHAMRRFVIGAAADCGQHSVAVREARKLLESSALPKNEAATILIKAYLLADRVAQAEQVLDEYFPINESGADGEALRAQVFQASNRHAEASLLFRKLADHSPEYREFALFRLARSQAKLGLEADAQSTLVELEADKARRRLVVDAAQQPDNRAAQLQAAEVLLDDGNPRQAAILLEQMIGRLGTDPESARKLAEAYRRLGRADLAAQWDEVSPD